MNSKPPDEFKPSPSTFSQPPSIEPSPTPSSYTDATPIRSPMTSDPPEPLSPVDGELETEIDSFITLQKQLQNPNTLIIHHL